MTTFSKQLLFLFFISISILSGLGAIKVPSSIDRDKEVATFKFDMVRPSIGSKVGSYTVDLKGSGKLIWKGFNTGIGSKACSSAGGELVTKVDKVLHEKLVKMAIETTLENKSENETNASRTSVSNARPSLFTEVNENSDFVSLNDLTGSKTVAFIDSLQNTIDKALSEKTSYKRILEFSIKRDFKSPKITAILHNSGNKPIDLKLPSKASDNFYILTGDQKIVGLDYGKKSKGGSKSLAPNKSVTINLVIPNSISASSGIVIFDHTEEQVVASDRMQKGAPKVRLCGFDREGKRNSSEVK